MNSLTKEDATYINSIIEPDDSNRRMLFVIPRTAGDVLICTSLLPSLKELYPELNLYFATEQAYFPIVEDNPHIHKIVPYRSCMDHLLFMEGVHQHKGWFEIAFLPYIQTQQLFTYQHNRFNRFAFELFTDNIKEKRNLIRMTQ